jgi:hypothetical protein
MDQFYEILYEEEESKINSKYFDRARFDGRYISLCKTLIDNYKDFENKRIGIVTYSVDGALGSIIGRAFGYPTYILDPNRDKSINAIKSGDMYYSSHEFAFDSQICKFDNIIMYNASKMYSLIDIEKYIKIYLCTNGNLYFCDFNKECLAHLRKTLNFLSYDIVQNSDNKMKDNPTLIMSRFIGGKQ